LKIFLSGKRYHFVDSTHAVVLNYRMEAGSNSETIILYIKI